MFLTMKQLICIWGIFVMILSTSSGFAQSKEQTAKYRLKVFGMNIGEYTVSQKTVNDDIQIEAITDVEVKIVFTYRVKYIQKSIYRDGCLFSSCVQTIKNGEKNSDMRLEKHADTYLIIENGDTTVVHNKITYSGSLLYFNEPIKISSIFKERTGEKEPITCIADHKYVITNKNESKKNEYEYKDGVLVRAKLIHSLATIYLERCN